MPVTIPPFTNVPAPGDPVASAWAQQVTQFAVDQYVAQPGTPASVNTELWLDTDDYGVSYPNMPRGFIAVAQMASDQTVTTAGADLTGVSVTWTADPTRRYRTWLEIGAADQTGATGLQTAVIADGSSTPLRQHSATCAPGSRLSHCLFIDESGLSGTITRKARFAPSAGSTVIAATGTQTYAPRIFVEDIGAAGQSGGGIYGTPTPWANVTFQNGWTNQAAPYQTCQYRKVGDIVYLRGMMINGTAGTVAFTLPAGFRPPLTIEIPTIGGTAAVNRMSIDSVGQCIAYGNPNFSIGGQFSVSVT